MSITSTYAVSASLATVAQTATVVASGTTGVLTTTIVTSQAPLTTILTPPASCFKDPFTSWDHLGNTTFWRHAFTLADQFIALCYPTLFSLQQAKQTGSVLRETSVIYSPGVCPAGYTAAQVVSSSGDQHVTSFCCPRYPRWIRVHTTYLADITAAACTTVILHATVLLLPRQ